MKLRRKVGKGKKDCGARNLFVCVCAGFEPEGLQSRKEQGRWRWLKTYITPSDSKRDSDGKSYRVYLSHLSSPGPTTTPFSHDTGKARFEEGAQLAGTKSQLRRVYLP